MYDADYSKTLIKKLIKLRKKNPGHYGALKKKMRWIRKNPSHSFKFLHYSMKQVKRVHIGHFVLTFVVDDLNGIVGFKDYEHHDKIY